QTTGIVTSGSASITGVPTNVGYAIGSLIFGNGIAAGTTVSNITGTGPYTLTLSANATASSVTAEVLIINPVITISNAATATGSAIALNFYNATAFTNSGSGTITIRSTANPSYPANTTWSSTMNLDGNAGFLNLFTGIYNNVIVNNTHATNTRVYMQTGINYLTGTTYTGASRINGAFTLTSGIFTPNGKPLTIAGSSLTRTSGTIDLSNTSSASMLTFANATPLTLPSGLFSANIYRLTLNGAGGVTLGDAITVDNTLTLTSGTLTTGANTLTINGTTSGTDNIETGSNGTLVYGGTGAQTISNLASSAVNNLTINNAAGVAVNSNITAANLTINGSKVLNVNAGKQLTVSTGMTNNGTLNLLSTSGGGTATILTPATITGTNTANVEQYLASSRNWYMSSPVTGATASAGPTYYKYVEALNDGITWTTVNSGNGFDVMTGYIVKPTTATTYNFNGTLNTGDKTISGLTSTATAKTGFNLVGNPYPSYVKWSEAVRTNVENTMWYRTHNGTNYKFYTYQVGVGAGGIGVPATVTDYIPPMQAFWVKVNASQTGSVQFLNSSRDHQDAAGSIFRAPKAMNSAMKLLRLQVSNTTENDETVLYFNANASDNLDGYDSQKMFNYNAAIPEIYTTAGAEKLVINGMSEVKYNTEIPLGFVNGQTNETNSFSIKATELKNFEAGTRVILRDKVDVVDYELNGDNAYTFTSDAVNSTNRFSLLFKSPSVTTDIDGTKNSSVYAYANANNNIVIAGTEKATYSVYNSVGMLIENGKTTAKLQTVNCKLQTGVYVVKVNNQTTKVIIK
ncbi:MAG: T9SS type A sorting domain-containing protein, partial [Paludibacter sp.]